MLHNYGTVSQPGNYFDTIHCTSKILTIFFNIIKCKGSVQISVLPHNIFTIGLL